MSGCTGKMGRVITAAVKEKADCKMTLNNGDNTILFAIIYGFQRVGLERTYIELRKVNKEYLLELSEKYLENHCL